jgi:SpoVK/Ycf46/Vps4 family AAA+-type ATPase
MTAAKHLLALLRSHIDGDKEQFLSVAMQMAAQEARQGHVKLAQELRDLVDNARSNKTEIHVPRAATIPLAQPKGELSNLVAVQYSDIRLSSMVLTPSLEQRLKRILVEQRLRQKLHESGLSPRRKILLIGPPGSGKTMTAAAIAGELHQPLFTVVLDGLITKFMGETASKLRLIFDAMSGSRGVYFFDEFDAIGARRTERNDVGEIRRVLNSFLQFLEKDNTDSLIIAATNHPELLDPALYRRFDDVIEYALPDRLIARRILETRLSTFSAKGINWPAAARAGKGLSQAELTRAAAEAAKKAVLENRKRVTSKDLSAALAERKAAAHR